MEVAPHQQPFASHPLSQLAALFAAGILAVQVFYTPTVFLLLLCLLASLLALASLLKRKQGAATILVMVTFLLAGSCLASIEKRSVSSDRVRALVDDGHRCR